MNLIRKIESIEPTSLYDLGGNIVYTIEGVTYINNKSYNKYLSILDFSVFEDKLYFFENSKLYEFKDYEFVEIISVEGIEKLKIIDNQTFFGWKKLSRKEKEFMFYDLELNFLWSDLGKISINSIKGVIFKGKRFDDTKFEVLDIKTGKSLWSYELPEGYTIFGTIQLVENVLFFNTYKDLNRYKKKIGIDVKTGKVLWEHNFEIPYEKNNIADTLNKDNNLCYGYLAKKYQVYNPVTGEMVLEKDMSSYYEQGVSPDKNAIYDNKLWFVSGKGENVKFGAVNLETSEMDFVKDFPLNTAEQNDEHFDTPVYHNGKLYLRGVHYNTLYIFEKEENIS